MTQTATQTAVKLTRDGSKPTLRSAPGPRALAHTRARLRMARDGRPSLRIVPGRAVAKQAWFAVGMLLTLVAGLLLTLVINTRLAEGTYTRNRLAIESSYLADRQEALTDELDAVRAPAALARQALALGMVPAASPAFISLAESRVLGVAEAASATGGFAVITSPAPPDRGAVPGAGTSGQVGGSAPATPATPADPSASPAGFQPESVAGQGENTPSTSEAGAPAPAGTDPAAPDTPDPAAQNPVTPQPATPGVATPGTDATEE